MEISLLGLIGIALATMFFGYFFGLLEGRGQGYRRGRKEEAAARPEAAALPPPPVAASKSMDERGLLALSLNQAGQPKLQVDGHEVDARSASAEQRRRLIDLMVMLKPWVEPAAPAATQPDRPKSAPAAEGAARASGSARGMSAPTVAEPTASPAMPASQLSLVAQIDSILQVSLAGTPLAAKAIRLAESLHGGAVVFVGSNQYDGVDRVPDPEIQAAIRAAIAEWEKKYTPG